MKNYYLLSILSICLLNCANTKTENTIQKKIDFVPEKYAYSITENELREMLYIYASDEYQGRDTGSKGQKLAVEFLKSKYQAMQVPSAYGNENYFQKVFLEENKMYEATLNINDKQYNNHDGFVVMKLFKDTQMNINEIVYAGHGIDTDCYSDYMNIDVKDKIVLVKSGEPKDNNGNFITTGTKKETKWSSGPESVSSKQIAAKKNGAKALWLVDDVLFEKYSPWFKRNAKPKARTQLYLKEPNFSMLMLSETLGKIIYPEIVTQHNPKIIQTTIKFSAKNNSKKIDSENVVAFIKGSKYPEEVIVISAHLDHVGFNNNDIYNGADDDGSGTMAVLEIAEAFKMAKNDGHSPMRSILFLHVTGEEKGLLGSRYYTDIDPIFPLENTVANLNIDMIGRTDPKRNGKRNYVYLIGSDKLSTQLHELSESMNTKYCNLELDYTFNDENDPNRFYYRSDHYNFAKNNIPVIFYFNGTHDDYHQPTDTPDKIEYDLLKKRTQLVFYTAWELANRKNRIFVDKTFK